MEAAGWQMARACPAATAVVCGTGNNAGDGLAAARHLHRWGKLAGVCCVDRSRLNGPAARELEALQRVGVQVSSELRLDGASAIVDAIFGTGVSRRPGGSVAGWLETINSSRLRVISVDLPSGLHAASGVSYPPCVPAQATIHLRPSQP